VFNALTGQVLTGPATAALPSVPVKISGTDVVPA
jgi:Rieske Fe-S protein